ncbi:MAG: HAMP domain-containing histidine kinase, partial [Myxococcales bacterium]|nr:HAMP domain-containing histidine kinase [Myxococcales bacterium]
MSSWLRSQWLAFQHSFDREEVLAGSHPKTTAVAVVGMWLVFGIIGYVPRLAEASQFVRPWIPILLSTIGGVFTLTVWREGARGPLALLATLLDNAFYSAAFVVAACSTQGGYAIGLAVTQGLVLIAFVAPTYALTLPFATVMTIPPLLAFAVWMPSAAVSVILLCSWVMMLVGSVWASRRRELLAAQKKLTAAVTAANQIADESVQAALATTLLSLGNFLHELRNHQTSIRANLSYVAMQANLDAEARAALDDALESQEAEEQLTRDTIASLKEKAGPEAESFLIDEVIERVRS